MNFARQYIGGDRAIWIVVLLLGVASVLLVYGSVSTLAYQNQGGNTAYYLFRHSMFIITGLGIMYMVHRIKFTYYSRIAQLALFLTIPLLILTLLVGSEINSAVRWLPIPGTNQTFQTSDLAKLALIMYVARVLSQRQNEIKSFRRAFLPVVLPLLVICALILPANFSTAAVLFASCLVLMFIGRISIKHITLLIVTGIVSMFFVFMIAKVFPDTFPRAQTWLNRVDAWTSHEDGVADSNNPGNYQVEQSKIAIATGGVVGKGPGNSSQRNILPHPYSDFIYAMVIEQYGLIGGCVVLLLYLILLYRAVRIVNKSPKTFGALLAIGIAFSLVLQALINMAVAVNLLPVTGQPLPLVSMGGTSIWFTCIAIGIILSVSRSVEKETVSKDMRHATA